MNGALPNLKPKGSFRWQAILKQLNKFKGIGMVHLYNGSIVFVWLDIWNNKVRSQQSPKVFSYMTKNKITMQHAK
jgi:hypothetical protein